VDTLGQGNWHRFGKGGCHDMLGTIPRHSKLTRKMTRGKGNLIGLGGGRGGESKKGMEENAHQPSTNSYAAPEMNC